MKIDRVRVDAFNNLQDWDWQPASGLNVVYGPNEAGKTSLKEFVTRLLFPSQRCSSKDYPAARTSDRGTLIGTLADGSSVRLTLDGKKSVDGGIADVCGLDQEEYRQIYSLDSEALHETKVIEGGRVRDRYLTVAGGNDLPAIAAQLDTERTALLPDKRRTAECGLARAQSQVDRRKQDETEFRIKDNQYSGLKLRQAELEKAAQAARAEFDRCERAAQAAEAAIKQANTQQTITELELEEAQLKEADTVTEQEKGDYRVLEKAADDARRAIGTAKGRWDDAVVSLGAVSGPAILAQADEIEDLAQNVTLYQDLKRRRGAGPTPTPAVRRPLPYLIIIGALLAIVGIGLAAFGQLLPGVAFLVVGAVIVLLGLRAQQKQAPIVATAPVPVADAQTEQSLADLEARLGRVAAAVGITAGDFTLGVARLQDLLDRALAEKLARTEHDAALAASQSCERERQLFLTGYGGEERYRRLVAAQPRLAEVRGQLSGLRKTLPDAGVEPAGDPAALKVQRDAALAKLEAANRDQSANEAQLKAILGDHDLDEAIDATAEAGKSYQGAVGQWAELAMERMLLDRASDTAYAEHRPQVLDDADRYLGLMTAGAYQLHQDPQGPALAVEERRTQRVKGLSECSAGLRDQVLLAVKMGVALSLSKERPPLILDDVLLTSDWERRQGAIRALADLSQRLQVLYFTCDRSTRDLLVAAGAQELDLSSP